jgi:hypothetical protein
MGMALQIFQANTGSSPGPQMLRGHVDWQDLAAKMRRAGVDHDNIKIFGQDARLNLTKASTWRFWQRSSCSEEPIGLKNEEKI